MRLVLHIGTEKTGSTSIQEFLLQNKTILQKEGYYLFPSNALRNYRADAPRSYRAKASRSYRELVAYCMNNDKYDDFFYDNGINTLPQKLKFKKQFIIDFEEEIENIPSSIHTVLITSEHFHSRTTTSEEVQNVYELLTKHFNNIKIICYLRDQASLIDSIYSTKLKSGHTFTFEEFLKECTPDNIYFNYNLLIKNWSNHFGQKNIDVALFDKNSWLNKNLLDDFTSKLSSELLDKLDKNIIDYNTKLDNFNKKIMRAINIRYPKYDQNTLSVNPLRVKCKNILLDSENNDDSALLNHHQKQSIYNLFYDSNKKVSEKYFNLCDKPLFNKPEDKCKSYSPDEDEQVNTLIRIFQTIANKP